jgi:hypothetical protein
VQVHRADPTIPIFQRRRERAAPDVLDGVLTLGVGPRGDVAMIVAAACCAWAIIAAPPRIRFYTFWVLAVIVAALIVRCGVFAARNARVWSDAQVVYATYASRVQRMYPSPARGAAIAVPAPPPELPAHHVPALLRWTYDDPTLKATVAGE